MISTLTPTVTRTAALGLSDALAAGLVAFILLLLIQSELALAGGPRWQPLAHSSGVVIVPLLIVFAIVAGSRLVTLV